MVVVELFEVCWKRNYERAKMYPGHGLAVWRYWAEPSRSAAREADDVEDILSRIRLSHSKAPPGESVSTYERVGGRWVLEVGPSGRFD